MTSTVYSQSNFFPFVVAIALALWSLSATHLISLVPVASHVSRVLRGILWVTACQLAPLVLVLIASDTAQNSIQVAAVFTWLVPYSLLSNRVWSRARTAAQQGDEADVE